MLTAALGVTAFILLARGAHGVYTDAPSLNPKLETDCSGSPGENQVVVIPDVSYAFRTDYLSRNECKAYERVQCSPTESDSCQMWQYDEPESLGNTYLRKFQTYFELDCSGMNQNYPAPWRSFLQTFAVKFSITSPKRALIMKIREGNGTNDPVHSDVFDPVRDQVIDITVQAVASTEVTSKIYNIGILASLVALHVENGKNLSIKRHDFNRIPNVRLIVFDLSTILEIQPYTFTDLPHLNGLSVDKGLWHIFHKIGMYEARVKWYEQESLSNPNEYLGINRPERPVGLWDDAHLNMIHRFHCDCSFAWYRNFLKSKPELIADKMPGAMAIIGSYMSESFFSFGGSTFPYVAAVDCTKNLTKDSYQKGDQFSYNTTCFGPCS